MCRNTDDCNSMERQEEHCCANVSMSNGQYTLSLDDLASCDPAISSGMTEKMKHFKAMLEVKTVDAMDMVHW